MESQRVAVALFGIQLTLLALVIAVISPNRDVAIIPAALGSVVGLVAVAMRPGDG